MAVHARPLRKRVRDSLVHLTKGRVNAPATEECQAATPDLRAGTADGRTQGPMVARRERR
jgi:hypothetical protein